MVLTEGGAILSTLWLRLGVLLTLLGSGWLTGFPVYAKAIERSDTTGEQGPAPQSGPLFTFQVLSDIHLRSWNTNAAHKFQAALLDAGRLSPAPSALIINGDLGDGAADDYKALNRLLRKLPHPERTWFTIGNHEFYQAWYNMAGRWSPETFPNGETEGASVERFLRLTGESRVYAERRIGDYRFLLLGSEQYRQSEAVNGEDARLSDDQLRWLELKLAEAAGNGLPVFVFLHQPLPNTVAGSDAASPGQGVGVIRHERLRQLLRRYPQTILFSGHTHAELADPRSFIQNGFTMVGSSSVYEPTGRAGPELSGSERRSEGLIVDVYADKVIVKGRDWLRGAWIREAQHTVWLKRPGAG